MTREAKQLTAAAICFVLVLVSLPFINLAYTRYFMPAHEAVRAETYEESPTYNKGKVVQLARLCHKFNTAGEGHASAMAGLIRMEASVYDTTRLPAELRTCVADATR